MKHLFSTIALALAATAPIAASAGSVTIDFEKTWSYNQGAVNGYYSGGKAQDGTSGPNLGVSFTNVSGFTNDPLGPYYSKPTSALGVAYVFDNGAFIDYVGYASGFKNFSLSYSNPDAQSYVITAFSGLDGSGVQVGSLTLAQNDTNNDGLDDVFTRASALFTTGVARSFNVSALAGSNVVFDDVTVVPEPGVLLLMVTGGGLAFVSRRKPRA